MEVGISLPRLSVIVIVGAERLGLATLHQLRGRVARNSNKGWCYLYTNNPQNERLKKFAVTKSGFEIAELDLEFRDSGDLLVGKEQSGKITSTRDSMGLGKWKESNGQLEIRNHIHRIFCE